MWRLVFLEIDKLLHKRLLVGGTCGLALIPILVAVTLKYGGSVVQVQGQTPMDGFVSLRLALFFAMDFFVPLFVAILTADTLAGEWSEGVLRLSLMRPVRRSRLLLAKGLAVFLATAFALMAFAVTGLAAGWLLFEHNALYLTPTETISGGAAALRVVGAAGVAALGLTVMTGITLLLSLFIHRPTGAALCAVAVTFGSKLLGRLQSAEPWLPTTYMGTWQKLLAPVAAGELARDLTLLLVFVALLIGSAALVFERADLEA